MTDTNLVSSALRRNGGKWTAEALGALVSQLTDLRAAMLEMESAYEPEVRHVPAERQPSARNLLHYVALRQHDVRALQEELSARGLSSLATCESYVLANVETVLEVLRCIAAHPPARPIAGSAAIDSRHGRRLIEQAAKELLGLNSHHPGPTVMVTMPSGAAEDYALVRDLLASGMDIMRINCAHDSEEAWGRMIGNLRQAERELQRSCRVAMDLGGPKIRTAEIQPGPPVVPWQPVRDAFGHVTVPGRVWLHRAGGCAVPPTPADAVLAVETDSFHAAQPGDRIRFRDAAGRDRTLKITQLSADGLWAESHQITFAVPGIELALVSAGDESSTGRRAFGRLGPMAPTPNHLVLSKGDQLLLTEPQYLGRPAGATTGAGFVYPAQIGCTVPEIFRDLRPGERVLLNDGKIGGVVREVRAHCVTVEITRARQGGAKLRAGKGINLPDSDLRLPALSAKTSPI